MLNAVSSWFIHAPTRLSYRPSSGFSWTPSSGHPEPPKQGEFDYVELSGLTPAEKKSETKKSKISLLNYRIIEACP